MTILRVHKEVPRCLAGDPIRNHGAAFVRPGCAAHRARGRQLAVELVVWVPLSLST